MHSARGPRRRPSWSPISNRSRSRGRSRSPIRSRGRSSSRSRSRSISRGRGRDTGRSRDRNRRRSRSRSRTRSPSRDRQRHANNNYHDYDDPNYNNDRRNNRNRDYDDQEYNRPNDRNQQRRPQSDIPENESIVIKGLDPEVTEDDVARALSKSGALYDTVRVVRNRSGTPQEQPLILTTRPLTTHTQANRSGSPL